MSDPEVAWVAGLLEGEGSFQICGERPGIRKTLTVRCSMTDLDIINRLAELVNGGPVNQSGYDNGSSLVDAPYKRIYAWQMSQRKDVVDFVNIIRPWMGERRKEQIDAILDYHNANPERVSYAKAPVHGTLNCYNHHSCRCELCRKAGTEARNAYRARKAAARAALG